MTKRDRAPGKFSLTRLALLAGLSVSVLSGSALVPVTGEAAAQENHFNQRQIIQKLRLPRGAKARRRQGNDQDQIVIKRRAPQQNNRVVKRRAPPSNGGKFVRRRAPQPQGGQVIVKRRAPQPQGGQVIVKRRAPQPQGGVAQFRAPPPTAKSRAPAPNNSPVVQRRAPVSRNTQVVSTSPVAPSNNQRGLQQGFVQEAGLAPENYPEQGRLDLEILFDYDSDRIDPKSVRQLIELGDALNDPELGSGRFMIAGHTDALGSDFYNADLSRRRANAVTQFLVEFAGVKPERLDAEGFGEEYLKYPDAPDSGQNRRVEIINLGEPG